MSRKDFNRGFEAAINAQKGFNQKQAEATEELGKRIGKKFDEFGNIIDFVLDDLNVSEKKRLYNLNNTHDISELGEQEKILLLSILYVLIKKYGQNNEYQKKYYFSVKKALNITNPDGSIDVSAVANVDNLNDSKAMYRVVCEFLFLAHSNHECGDVNDEILSNFNVNKKTADDILNQIIEVYDVLGIEGILNHYNTDEKNNNDFEKEISANDGPNFVLFEDITISSMTHIAEGEILEYRNKNITIETTINCEGTLAFHSCNITFNSPNKINEIELKNNATLVAENCRFISLSHIDKTFIKCGDLTSITFDKCQFNDCSNFIVSTGAYIKEFSIVNATITNCLANFVHIDNYGEHYTDRKIIFKDNIINNEFLLKPTCVRPIGYSHSIIYINNKSENTEVCVSDNLIVEKPEYRENVSSGHKLTYFLLTNSEVSNCTFIGAKDCVEAKGIYDCVFKNCSSPTIIKYKGRLKNCLFRNCISSIVSEYGTTISYSKFVGCKGNLFDGCRQGGNTIEYCEIINHINTGNDYAESSIIFYRDEDKNSKSNSMKNCIFNGCVLNKNYLVSTHCYEKPRGIVGYIENCNFKNIRSHNENGIIIREKDSYFGFLDVQSEFTAISVYNCTGIENVNKENSVADKTIRDAARELENKLGASITN